MPIAETEFKQTHSFDDMEIDYQVIGKVVDDDRPWMVFVNGLGAGVPTWRHQVAYLNDLFRFLAWEYRGMYTSEEPPPPIHGHPVETHARDIGAIVQAEGVQGGVWVAWSYGAQVLLDAFQRGVVRPDQIVLVNPCYGRQPSSPSRLRRSFSHGMWVLERFPEWVERGLRRAGSWPETASWLKRFGIVASSMDEDALGDVVRHFRTIHAPAYLDAVRAASSHRIDGILGTIDVPTLVILGEKDVVTPRRIAEPLARQIPDVELFVVRGATHFALLEFPELINLRVEKFLREQGR